MRHFAIALLLAAACMPLIYCHSEETELDTEIEAIKNTVANLLLEEVPTRHPCDGILCIPPDCPRPIMKGCCPVCPTTKPKVCYLPKVAGPCRGYIPSYYYNRKTGQCQMFIYGGCGGNGNRFETQLECLKTCGSGEVVFPE